MKAFCFFLSIFLGLSSAVLCNEPNEIPNFYKLLVNRLAQDGFGIEFLSKLFADSRTEPLPSLMTVTLYPRETTDLYRQFLTSESILLSKKFLQQNQKILREMEKRFHVEEEVVVAILLVESRFGENIGKYRVLPTLASITLMDSPENLSSNHERLREIDPGVSYEWVEEIAKKRSKWAYHELKCFLKIIQYENIDPLEVRGSYAGALGMAQFIPSSYLAFAENTKSFEKWLHGEEEAIFSIGNYLRSHGWKRGLSVEKKRRILWYYNHSEPYIETVLEVARQIKAT